MTSTIASIRNEDGELQSTGGKSVDEIATTVHVICPEKKEDPLTDRGWAWMVPLGVHVIFLISLSGSRILAVLLLEIVERFDTSVTTISIMLSLETLAYTLATQVSTNILTRKWTIRTIAITATVVNVLATLTFVAFQEFYVFFIADVIKLIAQGCILINGLALVNFYFRRHRALATNLALTGFSVATIIVPPLTRYMREEFGFRGCFLLVAGMEMQGIVGACLLRPHVLETCFMNIPHIKRRPLVKSADKLTSDAQASHPILTGSETKAGTDTDAGRTCTTEQEMAAEPVLTGASSKEKGIPNIQSNGVPYSEDDKPSLENNLKDVNLLGSSQRNNNVWGRLMLRVRIILAYLIDKTLLKNPLCVMTLFGYGFMYSGSKAEVYVPAYAEEEGHNPTRAATLLSIIGAVGMVSRLSVGVFADLKIVKASTIVAISGFIMTIILGLTPLLNTFEILVVCAVIMGMFQNSWSSLNPSLCLDVVGTERLAKMMALGSLVANVLSALTNIIHGLLRDHTGTFAMSQQYMGGSYFIGALFLVGTNLLTWYKRPK